MSTSINPHSPRHGSAYLRRLSLEGRGGYHRDRGQHALRGRREEPHRRPAQASGIARIPGKGSRERRGDVQPDHFGSRSGQSQAPDSSEDQGLQSSGPRWPGDREVGKNQESSPSSKLASPAMGRSPKDCPALVGMLCDWLNGPDFVTDDPALIFPLGLIRAIVAHLYIAWIHPFGDGNGRTARLVEFQLLLETGAVSAAGGSSDEQLLQPDPQQVLLEPRRRAQLWTAS